MALETSLSCELCRFSGTLEEWERMASLDRLPPNRHQEMSALFRKGLDSFAECYHREPSLPESLGYDIPCPPPGDAFTLMQKDELPGNIGGPGEVCLVMPVFSGKGIMSDFLVHNGKKFARLDKDRQGLEEYCGSLPGQSLDKLFVTQSPARLIALLGRQARERVQWADFPVIADMGREPGGSLTDGKILSDFIYIRGERGDGPAKLWSSVRGARGCVRVIEDSVKYPVAVMSSTAFKISRRAMPGELRLTDRLIREHSKPYRFYIDGGDIRVHNLPAGKPELAVGGLIRVERTDEGLYRVMARPRDGRRTIVFEKVPEEVFGDRKTVNSLLASAEPGDKKKDKPVSLARWFRGRHILSNLALISRMTSEALPEYDGRLSYIYDN